MQEIEAKGIENRKTYIEAMRIVAILFVIFNHTNTVGFVHFIKHEPASVLFWLNMFFSVFCKFGAPLFFMISGALLLNRSKISIRELLKKRVAKYSVVILSFSFFYALSNHILTNQEYTFELFFKQLYSSSIKYHLWFLYAYIAFLLLIPLLQSWCQHMEDKHFIYIIILHIIFRLITVVQFILFKGKLTISSNIVPTLPINIITIPIIGYYLENRITIHNISKKKMVFMWLSNILFIVICCIATYIKGMESGKFSENDSQTFFSTFAFFNCLTIYLTMKKLFGGIHLKKTMEKTIQYVGSCCFGIYLFHPMFKDMPYVKPLIATLQNSGTPHIFIMIIYILAMFVPAFLFTICMKKIASII